MFRKIDASEAPKRPRKSTSRFERTGEWKQMKACLDKGLKPDEALEIVLTAEDKAKLRISNRRTVARFIQKYLADHKLPYTMKSFRRGMDDYFLVMNLSKLSRR